MASVILLSLSEERDEVEEANCERISVMGPARFLATSVMLWLSSLAEATVNGLNRKSKMNDWEAGYFEVLPLGGRLRYM